MSYAPRVNCEVCGREVKKPRKHAVHHVCSACYNLHRTAGRILEAIACRA